MTRTRSNNRGFSKPKTHHEFGGDQLFDDDISGLHKLVQPKKILTKTVRYLPPSISQVPYMINFMIEAFADLMISREEMNKLDRNELFLRVVNFVVETTQEINGDDAKAAEEGEQILGSAFGSRAAIDYLFPVMQQCFPDLHIHRITNECFLACFNTLFSDMFVDS